MAFESNGLKSSFAPGFRDTFVDEAVTFELTNGTVRVSLANVRMSEPAAPSEVGYVITERLIMPVGTAQRLALGLYDYLKNNGLDPAPPPEDTNSIQ